MLQNIIIILFLLMRMSEPVTTYTLILNYDNSRYLFKSTLKI